MQSRIVRRNERTYTLAKWQSLLNADCLETENGLMFCKACSIFISDSRLSQVIFHLYGARHALNRRWAMNMGILHAPE